MPALPALLRGLPGERHQRQGLFRSGEAIMTTVVTGATGFLGSALVTELITRQQAVRILARDEQKARQQFGEAVTIIQGDITNAAQVRQAVEGASTIYHLAGRLYHPSVPAELYRQSHVEGTRNLLEACQGQAQL